MNIIKKNMKKIVISMLAICLVCTGTLWIKVYASEEYAVNTNMKSLMEEIDIMLENSDQKMMSSNPYDYIDNTYFQNIVNRGIAA